MKEIYVNTQAELDKALKDRVEGDVVICRGTALFQIRDSSQVTACDSSQVTATKFVAITIHSKSAKISGGVKIKLPAIKTAKQWCEFYGVAVKAGVAILFKAVRGDYKSSKGFLYQPGTAPEAPDWDEGKAECGGGLHFSPSGK